MIKDMDATSTLDAPYDGPFKVVRRTTHGTYVLRDSMNRLLARNYAPEQLKLAFKVDDPTEVHSTHEVENIVSHQLDERGEMLYEVKWKGYESNDNTYERYENFNSKSRVQF